MLQLLTFGGPELVGGTLPGRRPLLLAAYLTVEGRQPRRRLAELFCEGNRDPLNQLSVNLTRLRRQLREVGAEGALHVDAAGVALDLRTDHHQFLAALELCDVARAVELHRGPFLQGAEVGLGDELFTWAIAVREALVERMQRSAVAEAGRLVAAGRYAQAGALADAAYAAAGQGGSDPAQVEVLHALIVLGGGTLRGESLAESRALGAAEGTEGERVRGLVARLRTGTVLAPTNLVAPLGRTVGRQRERLELAALLRHADARLVTLVGEGGIGKSRLALQVAADRHATGDFPGGVVVVNADGAVSADALGRRCLSAAPWLTGGELVEALARLRGRRSLLVLDDVGAGEAELDAAATLIGTALGASPDLSVLATATRRLAHPGERVFRVAGLGQDGPELFSELARAINGTDAADPAGRAGAARLSETVGGSPLALAVAAGLAGAMSAHDLAALIEREPAALGELRGVPPRLRSPAARFAHTVAELSAAGRAALARLAYFEPGFTREAVAEVTGVPATAVLELQELSLLAAREDGCLELGKLTRLFARRLLVAEPDLHASTARAHVAYYASLPLRHYRAAFGPEQAAVQRLLHGALPNSLLAFRHALELEDGVAVQALSLGCYALFGRLGRFDDAIALFGEGLAALRSGSPETAAARGQLLAMRAKNLIWLGRVGEAEADAERALAMLLPVGHAIGVRKAYLALAECAVARQDPAAATRYFDLARGALPPEYPGAFAGSDALVQMVTGELGAAAEALQAAVESHRRHGNAGQEAVTHFRLAGARFGRGELGLARRSFERALKLTQGVYPYYEHASRLGLARTLAALGDTPAASRLVRQVAAGGPETPPDLARAAAALLEHIGMGSVAAGVSG
ncbi:MAG: NB-ARC domain-containing protein [Trueperaceae bacterium]|nr:NB-ARC domain-containing protein [Trueperaceae bacterium]